LKSSILFRLLALAVVYWNTFFSVSIAAANNLNKTTKVDWSVAAQTDIEFIHSTLSSNHPGSVDTENRRFAKWLEDGKTIALTNAKSAITQADYWRAVRAYTNGFRDGHIWFGINDAIHQWPGFLTRRLDDGRTQVVLTNQKLNVPLGSLLKSCDGIEPDELVQKMVTPFRWNADIPHEKNAASVYLFAPLANDKLRPRKCQFSFKERVFSQTLNWKSVSNQQLDSYLQKASGNVVPTLGLRQVDGVWLVSLPTFNFQDKQVDAINALLKKLETHSSRLQKAHWVVLDMRGNTGGNSGWGSQVARKLYGNSAVDRIEGQFNWTVDWRVSAQNAMSQRHWATIAKQNGQIEEARERNELADELEIALSQGQTYLRRNDSIHLPITDKEAQSPFKGQVFLLTDNNCASACLDFADIARRLPDVLHIGLPTSADAVYIDNTDVELPSGQGQLSYSMKAYRNRIRANNEWYEPHVRWPGGSLTDSDLAFWVKNLKTKKPSAARISNGIQK
jgi:hypothetical protein